MSTSSEAPCAECAHLVYDQPGPTTAAEQLDAVRWHVEQALYYAMEVLPPPAAFTLVNDIVWRERPKDMPLAPRRVAVSPKLRAQILERDEHACVECGATDELQIDHTIPVAKGGPTEEWNLRTLCAPCNAAKGSQ